MSVDELKLKTVAVLGGSYGGNRAAQVLAAGLPNGWRVVLVDRNSHFNHVYNLPRYIVLPGHEHKAFIPYDNLFNNPCDSTSLVAHPHKRIHGTITSIHPHHITYTPHANSGLPTSIPSGSPSVEKTEEVLRFDYAIYALGSHLPSPIDLWVSRDTQISSAEAEELPYSDEALCIKHIPTYVGVKRDSISRLRSRQRRIEAARQVLVVGGGALGIQFASDIAAVYPGKSVTLLHSRSRLLPKFDEALGDEVYQGLQELGVHVIFGERLDMSSFNDKGTIQETMLVKTVQGREIEADLVLLCTGQTPNTSLLHTMDSHTIDPKSGMVRVLHTMQILALKDKGIAFDKRSLDEFRSASPTLCGTVPPSPVDTLVEPDFTSLVSKSSAFTKSAEDVSLDTDAFVYPHLFAIGDAADAFGAIKAGHTAYYQGEMAARNVIKLVKGESKVEGDSPEENMELEEYAPSLPMIKVSLGLTKSAYEVAGVVGTKDDGTDDLGASVVWGAYGYRDIDEEGMWV